MRSAATARRSQSSNNNTDAPNSEGQPTLTGRAVWAARTAFLVILFLLAALLGVATHHVLRNNETQAANDQFNTTSLNAVNQVKNRVAQQALAAASLAVGIERRYHSAAPFPLVTPGGFPQAAQLLQQATNAHGFCYTPLVDPTEQDDFVAYMYPAYAAAGYPSDTAVSSFGRGIWAINLTSNASDASISRYHDTTGRNPYSSVTKHTTQLPVAWSSNGPVDLLLFNIHLSPTIARAVEPLLSQTTRDGQFSDFLEINPVISLLSEQRRMNGNNNNNNTVDEIREPSSMSMYFHPVYPHNDPDQVCVCVPARE